MSERLFPETEEERELRLQEQDLKRVCSKCFMVRSVAGECGCDS